MKYLFTFIALLFLSLLSVAQDLKPTQEKVVVTFIVTDYNKIPEVDADVEITLASGEKLTIRTGEDGKLKALISKGDVCTMLVKKFGREFLFDDKLKIVDQPGLFILDHTLKIRLIVAPYVRQYVLKGVNFDTNKWNLRDDAQKPLKILQKTMKKNPKLVIELAGHTDSVGEDEDNMLLSQRRSSAVKAYLLVNDIEDNRILAKGYGETVPSSTNDTPEGRQENRRTEVRVISE